jgi:hypothetical protein
MESKCFVRIEQNKQEQCCASEIKSKASKGLNANLRMIEAA